jgi:uncharacterized membrane protein YtjA (UPF0391 family)
MLALLIGLIVIAVVAGALGFTGIAVGAALAARIVFFIMAIGIVIMLILVFTGILLLT